MKIDPEKCISCLECIDYCPMKCILEGDEATFIDQDECVECGVCLRAAVCPTDAIYMPEEAFQYPRSIRREFSDPGVQYPTLKQGGRGTEEMKPMMLPAGTAGVNTVWPWSSAVPAPAPGYPKLKRF